MKRVSFRHWVGLTIVWSLSLQSGLAEPTVLYAHRMLDVVTGEMLSKPVLVIEGDRITAVNPETVPVSATSLNWEDVTLLPGLIDTHTHLTSGREGDWVHRSVKQGPANRALVGVRSAWRTLMAGFTTVRDLGTRGFADVALMKAIDSGVITGPRIVPSGHPLGITGGHCDITGYRPGLLELGPREGVADGVDQVVQAVRYQIKHGARVIKTCATAGVFSFEGPVGAQQYSDEELRAMVEEAARHGIKVAAHAHGTEGILAAARAGVASIEHGSVLTDEAIQLMKSKGTYLVPTAYLVDVIKTEELPPPIRAKSKYLKPLALKSLEQAIQAGVKIAFGTDAAVFPHGDNAHEFGTLVNRGMSELEALRTATLYATDLLGVSDRGVLEVGRLADLVAVPGNPLEDIRVMERVSHVIKGGEVVKDLWGPRPFGERAGPKRPRVVLIGDSIRIGYQAVVKKALAGEAQIWAPEDNCRYAAYTLEHLDEWISSRRPDVVHLNVGLHDMYLMKETGAPRTSLKDYGKNLRRIVERIRREMSATLILGLTTPVHEQWQEVSEGYGRVVRRDSDVVRYNQVAQQLAKEFSLPVNDLYGVVSAVGKEELMTKDGVHFNPRGNNRLGNAVAGHIRDALGGLSEP